MTKHKIQDNGNRDITLRMPKASLKKWLKALRSGTYKQGRGVLYNPNDASFCCLGVLQHCLNKGQVELAPGSEIEFAEMPSLRWYKQNGITLLSRYGSIDPDFPSADSSASSLNDDWLASFEQIADAIERHAEGY